MPSVWAKLLRKPVRTSTSVGHPRSILLLIKPKGTDTMKTIITAAAFAVTTATSVAAYGVTDCPMIAETTGAIVTARDNGASKSQVLRTLLDGSIEDQTILQFLLSVTPLVFETNYEPEVFEELVFLNCVDSFSASS